MILIHCGSPFSIFLFFSFIFSFIQFSNGSKLIAVVMFSMPWLFSSSLWLCSSSINHIVDGEQYQYQYQHQHIPKERGERIISVWSSFIVQRKKNKNLYENLFFNRLTFSFLLLLSRNPRTPTTIWSAKRRLRNPFDEDSQWCRSTHWISSMIEVVREELRERDKPFFGHYKFGSLKRFSFFTLRSYTFYNYN